MKQDEKGKFTKFCLDIEWKDTELSAHPLRLIPLFFFRKLSVIHACIEIDSTEIYTIKI